MDQLSLRMQLIKLHIERVAIELKIKLLREEILKEKQKEKETNNGRK